MRFIFGFIVVTWIAGCSTTMGNREADIDGLMGDYSPADGPGASVLVLRDGKPVFRRAYGLADVDAGVSATPETAYRLASITKQFSAMSILILTERGKVSLDDPISRFFPEFPQYGREVTVRHLLTHTSGLPDYEDFMPPGLQVPLRDLDVLRIVEENPHPRFAAGAEYSYSNSGYALLALIVERASGKSFASFLHDEIFAPLRMTGTVAYEEGISTVAHRAYGHSREDGRWHRTDQSLTSSVLGDGGIYSSIQDLAFWDRELTTPHLVRPETLQQAFRPAVTVTDLPGKVQYGFGWRISDYHGHQTLWHTGETIGFRNALLRFPGNQLTVIVLSNRNEGTPIETARKIAGLFLP